MLAAIYNSENDRQLTLCSAALQMVSPICGKVDKLASHLKKCRHIPDRDQPELMALLGANKENTAPIISTATSSNSSPLKRAKTHDGISASSVSRKNADQQAEFSGDLCKLFVACSFLWLAVGNPQMHLFTDKWMPGMAIPDRRVLSGRVLDSEVARVEMQLADKVNGKLGTGQCDGWKNVAKTNVITSMMTVENEVRSYSDYLHIA